MIEQIAVRNFKSLAQFRLRLERFNCLVGMNGAGKSTVLQAIDFIAQLMEGRIDEWLTRREWSASELNCKLRPESNIGLAVSFRTSSGQQLNWVAAFNRTELQCSTETIVGPGGVLLHVKGRHYRIDGGKDTPLNFKYQGSILSQLRDEELPPPLLEFRDCMRRIRSLELLAPNLMRRRARSGDTDIGAGGEKLTAFLHGIKGAARERLLELLRSFYPTLVDFKVSTQRAGWKKLTVFEQFGAQRLETEARHINDGLLRVLAVLAQADSDRSLILLDEIENGMNPEIIEKLVDALVQARQQILVTTHSPMILNYLDDAVARESVTLEPLAKVALREGFFAAGGKGGGGGRPFLA